ncbi:uncharacterized protein LOC131329339 [Rhododendron vialii]|uniref:uncharacterized protein LOC131329339 n=1 Tax=Rhododendron vialii TaxID=182163 RepID=UPI00265F017B|nr:uncharacterized protein LOC131329339 [Rhododendron vialii]
MLTQMCNLDPRFIMDCSFSWKAKLLLKNWMNAYYINICKFDDIITDNLQWEEQLQKGTVLHDVLHFKSNGEEKKGETKGQEDIGGEEEGDGGVGKDDDWQKDVGAEKGFEKVHRSLFLRICRNALHHCNTAAKRQCVVCMDYNLMHIFCAYR